MLKDPLNIALLDIDSIVKAEGLKEVTSEFIRESSSNRFHPEGLFSEEIFGEIASQKRQLTCGYIKLNCRVFHPVVFQNLKAIKRFYVEIMAGTSYAVWDPEKGDFEHALESERNASTGMSFFLKHFDKINFLKNNSLKRNDKIDVIEKYKKTRLIDKLIVIPAGIRDIKDEGGRVEKDSINSLYASLLRNARSMSSGSDTNPFFDTVHYTIQRRVMEIYDALLELTSGKKGFFESKYSKRNVARSTRNVVTATDLDAASPDSPQYHKIDETKVPLFQAAKAAADLLVYWYKTLFYDQFVNISSENVAAINAKTHVLEYIKLDPKDKDRFTTSEGVEKTIDRFRDPFNRFKPVMIYSDGKPYYLFMVYDRGDKINIVRNVDEFKQSVKEAGGVFDEKLLRPITNIEMLYIACYSAYIGVHATTTRYPVTDEQSIFVSKTHLVTTSPSRVVRLSRAFNDDPADIILPEYPVEGAKFIDALMIHPTRLKSLNADFDGNCVTGDTTVEIRFKDEWLKTCMQFADDYDTESFEYAEIINSLEYIGDAAHTRRDGWMYATIEIGRFPKLGDFTHDKRGARVYDVPSGIEVRSYWKGKDIYLPIEKFTVEDNCRVAEVSIAGHTVRVSTNESLAAFNHFNGELSKVTPGMIHDRWVPFIAKAVNFPAKVADTKSTYLTGYAAASKIIKLSDIRPYSMCKATLPYKSGFIAGIIDKFGTLKDVAKTGVAGSITVLDQEDANVICELFYVLGVCCSSISYTEFIDHKARKQLIRKIAFNVKDLWPYAQNIKFVNQHNRHIWNLLKFRKFRVTDLIPVTGNEKRHLIKLARDAGDVESTAKFENVTRFAYERGLLKKFIHNDNTPLGNRIYSLNVKWGMLHGLTRFCGTETVYDFVIPTSKVYAVNNGLVIFDTCSWVPIFSKEANDECAAYLKTAGNYMLPSGKPLAEMMDDLCKISFHALTRDVAELKKR